MDISTWADPKTHPLFSPLPLSSWGLSRVQNPSRHSLSSLPFLFPLRFVLSVLRLCFPSSRPLSFSSSSNPKVVPLRPNTHLKKRRGKARFVDLLYHLTLTTPQLQPHHTPTTTPSNCRRKSQKKTKPLEGLPLSRLRFLFAFCVLRLKLCREVI